MSRPFERFAVGIETVTKTEISELRQPRPRLIWPLVLAAAAGAVCAGAWWLQGYLTPERMLFNATAGIATVGAGLIVLRRHPDRNLMAALAGLFVVAALVAADTGLLDSALAALWPAPG